MATVNASASTSGMQHARARDSPGKDAGQVMAASTKTGYCYDPTMMLHAEYEVDQDDGFHPEQPARISRIFERLKDAGCIRQMRKVPVRKASRQEILLVHSPDHWERVQQMAFFPDEHLLATAEFYQRASLYLNRESSLCARLSCGGVIELCRAVAEGQIRNGFAIVRPPGHHAVRFAFLCERIKGHEPDLPMGFCFFNSVAVAARLLLQLYASKGLKKVLILDWDVHHGNGTQRAFYDDPNVLYISLHMFEHGRFYPGGGYGGPGQTGEGPGLGYNVNIGWNETGMNDADYLYAFQQLVMPIAFEFDPDFVIVSAGYDAAAGDELGQCKVTPAGFAHMTQMLSSLAGGKIVLALEGGYNLHAISTSALECVKVLLGDLPPKMTAMTCSAGATQAVYEAAIHQQRYWHSVSPHLGQPRSEGGNLAEAASLCDILKAHRSHDLFHNCNLVNVELVDERLQTLFEDQIFCSENVFDCETLVVFMHEIGTVQSSDNDARHLDIRSESEAMIDAGRQVVTWAQLAGHGIIDVNIIAKPTTLDVINLRRSDEKEDEALLALHVWDYYIQPSQAKKVVFIGLTAGAAALMAVINARHNQVQTKVKASLSVLGRQQPPLVAGAETSPGLRAWYSQVSKIISFEPQTTQSQAKKYGALETATSENALSQLAQDWPRLSKWITSRLSSPNNSAPLHVALSAT